MYDERIANIRAGIEHFDDLNYIERNWIAQYVVDVDIVLDLLLDVVEAARRVEPDLMTCAGDEHIHAAQCSAALSLRNVLKRLELT